MLALFIAKLDKKNPAKWVDVVAEEEIKVEEEWVQNEYEKEFVQHVINMNQSYNWVDIPKDDEIRIAKKKSGARSMHCRAQQVCIGL
jgi:hypothetical protein